MRSSHITSPSARCVKPSTPTSIASATPSRSSCTCSPCARHAMSEQRKVVLTDYVWDSLEVEQDTLRGLAHLVALQAKKPEEFLPEAADCDALLNTYAGPITAEIMARMPKCKIIARYGIGVDTIDLDAATEAGIIVTNNPTYCIEEVADHTLALLLACARKIPFYDRLVRGRRWDVPPGKPLFRLAGRTLGLVGFGNIARAVAGRAAAFGIRVLYCDPFVQPGQFAAPGEKREFFDMLSESDFVSVHAPLLPETRGMMSDEAFARMKPTAFLINCARGPIVDTGALVRALHAGRIAGCALDTTDPEPLPDPHPLRGRDNVIITPHAAWYSEHAMVGLQSGAPSEVRRVLTGTWPVHVVNRAVKGKTRAGL
ncbi:MAG: hydroxyacid dehydrogenase [Candidatus Rokuibacteriota bacterium]|nr:MAG: hydroxyacid dehydrogenase [Candidatus Rokubacteria bacterium]